MNEWERDLIQSLLDVGSAALFVGLGLWVLARALGRGGSQAASDDLAGAPEEDRIVAEIPDRRKGPGRRASDRR